MSDLAPTNVPNETWLEFLREATATKRAIEEASSKHRTVLKRAKAAGCNPKVLAIALAAKTQDPAVVVSEIRDTVRVLNLVNVTMKQTDLFGGWEPTLNAGAAAVQALFDAEERGYAAGKAGAAADENPYELGTEAAQSWGRGWSHGVDAAKARAPEGAAQANASRKRPSRTAETAAAPEVKKRSGRKPAGDAPKPKGRGAAAATH
jgi:ribosome modulation factor